MRGITQTVLPGGQAALPDVQAADAVRCDEQAGMKEGQVKCSLRSIGQLDTTAIAQLHGGGGHLNASSFVTSASKLQQWLVA